MIITNDCTIGMDIINNIALDTIQSLRLGAS